MILVRNILSTESFYLEAEAQVNVCMCGFAIWKESPGSSTVAEVVYAA